MLGLLAALSTCAEQLASDAVAAALFKGRISLPSLQHEWARLGNSVNSEALDRLLGELRLPPDVGARLIERYDGDGDGKISVDELRVAYAQLQAAGIESWRRRQPEQAHVKAAEESHHACSSRHAHSPSKAAVACHWFCSDPCTVLNGDAIDLECGGCVGPGYQCKPGAVGFPAVATAHGSGSATASRAHGAARGGSNDGDSSSCRSNGDGNGSVRVVWCLSAQAVRVPSSALLVIALLVIAFLVIALLVMALLVMALLVMALLVMALPPRLPAGRRCSERRRLCRRTRHSLLIPTSCTGWSLGGWLHHR